MKVEIWSDVMCPFCYIGKRKFEAALEEFPHKNDIKVEWKSFQLNPHMKTDPRKNINEYLAEHKSVSLFQAKQMNDRVTEMAKEVGLHYDFDKAIVANSFDAHRLSHLSKKHGKQNELEEQLFKAYFTDGKNTADHETLIQLGSEIGIDAEEIHRMLISDEYSDAVQQDAYEAQQVGARGVPFFIFDDKYAVSGAQPSKLFLQVIEKAYNEWINRKSY